MVESFTPIVGGHGVKFYNIKVYGTSCADTTAHSVLLDHLSHAPTDVLPAGDDYRAYVQAPAGDIEPLEFGYDASELAVPEEVVKYHGYLWGWYPKRVAGKWYVLPHFIPRPTTPRYHIDAKDLLEPVGFGADMEPLASVVRVTYTNPDGLACFVDVTDTDPTHELVKRSITKREVVSAEVKTAAAATDIGELFLADAGRPQVNATLRVKRVRNIYGAIVPFRRVRPGLLVRLTGIGQTPINALVRSVRTNDATAEIAVDNQPYALDVKLARLSKNATNWS
jgi:hypothetical protein